MTTDNLATPIDARLIERARALRVSLWSIEPNGLRCVACMATDNAQQVLLQIVAGALTVRSGASSPSSPTTNDIIELVPGGLAMQLDEAAGKGSTARLLAVAITPVLLAGDAFDRACGSADLSTSAAVAALHAICKHDADHAREALTAFGWSHADLAGWREDESTINEFAERLGQAYEETNLWSRIGRTFNSSSEPQDVMRTACQQLHEAQTFGWIAMAFGDRPGVLRSLREQLIVSGTLPCESAALATLAQDFLRQCTDEASKRILTPRAKHPLALLTGAEVLAEPIIQNGEVVGVLLAGNRYGPDPDISSFETQFGTTAAKFVGVFHQNLFQLVQQKELFFGTVRALSASIDAKDPYTCGHSERVGLLAGMVGTALGLPPNEVEDLRVAGLLHDVGKIGVPEAVLTKPGKLTDEEFAQIKRHPVVSHAILKGIPGVEALLPAVLHHHESWSGTGYPHKLAGEQIPLAARVLAVCDTFDAMSSTRSYRRRLERAQVLDELRNQAGRQFWPDAVHAFLSLDLAAFDALLADHERCLPHAA
ncbi:MAG TPA: HD-GYP domain-containing protein [Tepidisphaeraceae bacterium]|nr:HD-GYP domain-containing protein [Tepidisphaeraceae bacterium]